MVESSLLPLTLPLCFFFFLAPTAAAAAALSSDGLSLLAFKSAVSADPSRSLAGWAETDPSPCYWAGVTCRGGRVVALALPGRALSGYLPSELGLLTALQNLSLPHNNLSGPIPAQVGLLSALLSLDLSDNNLSGWIPSEMGSLRRLAHLDLSSNRLNGSLPPSVASLPDLTGVLNLSCNGISGRIPVAYGSLPVAVSIDLRHNNLSGEIPQTGSLLNQGPPAFAGNPGLCGFPLKNPCDVLGGDPRMPLPTTGLSPHPSFPGGQSPPEPGQQQQPPKRRKAAAVPILSGVLLAAVGSVLLLHWRCRRGRGGDGEDGKAGKGKGGEERREGQIGEELFVPVDEGFALELEELLRASAYVVGKSRSGIVYKVVVGRGAAVAVRRLSEGDGGGGEGTWRRRREFESEAMAVGRVRHPNVVGLRAYYYAPDEKLLVYDYISNGNLHGALHGASLNPAAAAAAVLPWAARLKIARGAARGLAHIHDCSPRKHVHGNIKSSKILLDDDLHPYVSGFGLPRLIAAAHKPSSHPTARKLGAGSAHHGGGSKLSADSPSGCGYLAPEARAAAGAGLTQKGDVYAFGVVLLEAVTGRLPGPRPERGNTDLESFVRAAFREERPLSEVVDPSLLHEVHAKKQVLAVFHVALGCTEPDPDARPRMRAVSESLDQIGGGAH